jgi:phosphoserine phosphatase
LPILTLIADPARAPLHAGLVRAVAEAVDGAPDWLAPGEAVDIACAAPDPARIAALLDGAPVDAIVVPDGPRRKRLLVSDMDSTIVTAETLDELAAHAGLKGQVAAITARSMNGEIDFATALRERVAMLRGLPLAALERTWAAVRLMPGARALVATMRAHGARTVLVSGGFTFFTARVAALCGFDRHCANVLLDDGAALTGAVAEPILDRDAKLATLRAEAAALGCGLAATLAVGDGANDLAMLGAAGLGVAFRARPVVAAAARARVEHCGLRALLFAQGFRQAEIVGGD